MIAIVNLKDIFKYLVGILMTILIVISSARFLNEYKEKNLNSKIEKSIDSSVSSIFNFDFLNCLKIAMPVVNIKDNQNINIEEYEDYILTTTRSGNNVKRILGYQMSILNGIEINNKENQELVENNEENIAKKDEDEKENTSNYNEEVILAQTNVETKIITDNNINASYTNKYNTIEVKNQTKFKLTDDMLTSDNFNIDNKKDVIIYHTHTCESYTATDRFKYKATGNYRTTDLNYSVSRVGDELQKYLETYGFNVVHNKTKHDYPAYNGSYDRSLETINKELKNNPDTQIVFDLHRDAVGSMSEYAPTVKIGDDYAAQIMFVIGTSGGGASHKNWKENLKFAVKIQEKANELYPGLFRPIILRDARYNQHVTNAASIIEVGATGNTLEQCLTSMKYLAKVLDEALK